MFDAVAGNQMQKLLQWGVLCALLLAGLLSCGPGIQAQLRGGKIEPAQTAPDFTLTDQNGNPFTLSSMRGQVVLLYFGYTSCPDVCPLTLADLRSVYDKMGADAKHVRVVFVTVDPERDTHQVLKKYVGAFDPSFIGLRGTEKETRTAADSFGVKFKKTSLPNSALGYAMDHSAFIYVIDRSGKLRETLPFGAAREDILNDVELLVRENISS